MEKNDSIDLDFSGIHLNISYTYREAGSELLFLIHGLGCSKEHFREIWSIDGLNDYSILAIDLAGFGESSKPKEFSYTLEDHACVCSSILSAFQHDTIHIIGHSMGGSIGVLLTDIITKKPATFINIEGNLINTDCTVSRRKVSTTFEIFEAHQLPALILSTRLSDSPGTVLWSQCIEKSVPIALYKSSQSLVHWSDSGLLLKKYMDLDCVKSYIYGSLNSGMDVLKMIRKADSICIPQCGHFPMNDNPSEFYEAVLQILNRNDLGSLTNDK